jgi:hypothetical protein
MSINLFKERKKRKKKETAAEERKKRLHLLIYGGPFASRTCRVIVIII